MSAVAAPTRKVAGDSAADAGTEVAGSAPAHSPMVTKQMTARRGPESRHNRAGAPSNRRIIERGSMQLLSRTTQRTDRFRGAARRRTQGRAQAGSGDALEAVLLQALAPG